MHVGIANGRWRGKRSWHSWRMRYPCFDVSGKRPIAYDDKMIVKICMRRLRVDNREKLCEWNLKDECGLMRSYEYVIRTSSVAATREDTQYMKVTIHAPLFRPPFWYHVELWPPLWNCKCRVSTPIFIRILHFDLKLKICRVSTPYFYECRILPLHYYRVDPHIFPTTCPLYISISFDPPPHSPPPPISPAIWPMYSFDTCFSTKAYDVETPPEYTPTPTPHREQP